MICFGHCDATLARQEADLESRRMTLPTAFGTPQLYIAAVAGDHESVVQTCCEKTQLQSSHQKGNQGVPSEARGACVLS